ERPRCISLKGQGMKKGEGSVCIPTNRGDTREFPVGPSTAHPETPATARSAEAIDNPRELLLPRSARLRPRLSVSPRRFRCGDCYGTATWPSVREQALAEPPRSRPSSCRGASTDSRESGRP